jgi:Lrp/AsnC family leucine-responsive transcriptional regulator
MKLDETDRLLLRSLQRNSKQTTKALARESGLSATAVYERIKRLEKQGVIERYVALVAPEKVEKHLKVFCQVKLSQHIKPRVLQFEEEVRQLDEVVSCYHIGGEYDYILEIYVRDMQAYREFMVGKLTAISHIGSTQSSFVIREVKHTTEIPLT